MSNIIEQAHDLLLKHITNESVTVDCTCGNGLDTLFLAQNSKKVYAFDIQESAINNTRELIHQNTLNNVDLIQKGHEFLSLYVKERIDAAIFNLGYLPKGDKSITTHFESTKSAIEQIVNLLNQNGIIVLVVYTGHSEGAKESNQLLDYLKTFSLQGYFIDKISSINHIKAPYIVSIVKR